MQNEHPPIAAERPLAGQQLVQHDAKAVHVAAGIDAVRLAASLFRRHVRRGAEYFAFRRHRGRIIAVAFRKTEVGQLRQERGVRSAERGAVGPTGICFLLRAPRSALRAQKDVRRLHVAVNDAVPVRRIEGVGDLRDELRGSGRGEGACLKAIGERDAVNQLLDEVAHAVRRPARLEERDDSGMLHLGGATGFAQESLGVLGAGQPPRPQNLDRHFPTKFRVERPIHGSERTASQFLDQLELADAARQFEEWRVRNLKRGSGRGEQRGGYFGRSPANRLAQGADQRVRVRVEFFQRGLAIGAVLDVPGDAHKRIPAQVAHGEPTQFLTAGTVGLVHGRPWRDA